MNESLLNKVKSKSARLSMIGLGYVGLPTALIFAEKGFRVIGCDTKKQFVDMINRGESPLDDLFLNKRIKKIVKSGRLRATTNIRNAVASSDIILIAVPTPTTDGFDPDLSYVISAGEGIASALKKGQLVILESTVYPGVTEEILKPILEKSGLRVGKDFGLAYCPERYNPGDSKHTIDKVVRILGGIDEQWTKSAKNLYESMIEIHVVSSIRTAEMAKIIENTQRDLNIALMNEIALICERLGLDVIEVIDAAATKWNFHPYYPGAGVGGHCLPKDPWYLVKVAEKAGYHAQVITAGRRINDYMPYHIFELLVKGLNEVGKPLRRSRIVVLGLSYKENIGDIRNSPSKPLIQRILEMGGEVCSVDPYISEKTALEEFGIERHIDKIASDFFKGADAIVIMTMHKEFHNIDLHSIGRVMKIHPVIIDGRRTIDQAKSLAAGFHFSGLGKG